MSGLPDWLVAAIAVVVPGFGAPPDAGFNGYLEADYVYASAEAPGRIASISVDEGGRVFEGQQLFTLDSAREKAALAAAEARVHVAEANLANLETGSREEEIAVIRAALDRAKADRDLAQHTLDRSDRLYRGGNIAAAQVDADRAALTSAEARVAELTAQLSVAELPARDAQRIAAEATLEAAKADVAAARSALDDRVVLAPATGLVDRVYFDGGEVAGAGAPVLSILPDGSLKALFFVPEAQRADFALGDAVAIRCSDCPAGLTASITRLAATPQYTPPIIYSRDERSRLVFRAEALLDRDTALLPGQPVTVEVPE